MFDGHGHVTFMDRGVNITTPGTGEESDVAGSVNVCRDACAIGSHGMINLYYDRMSSSNGVTIEAGGVHTVGQITRSVIFLAVPLSSPPLPEILPVYALSGRVKTLVACTSFGGRHGDQQFQDSRVGMRPSGHLNEFRKMPAARLSVHKFPFLEVSPPSSKWTPTHSPGMRKD